MTEKERIVPCGSCQACCRREWIILDPAAGDVIELYETEDVVDARTGKDAKALAHKTNGDCLYLGAAGCTIHSRRPQVCRSFDCRVHYLNMMKKPRREREQALRGAFNVRELFGIGRDMLKKYPIADE
jgi:Fe-S-cluster containining protein